MERIKENPVSLVSRLLEEVETKPQRKSRKVVEKRMKKFPKMNTCYTYIQMINSG